MAQSKILFIDGQVFQSAAWDRGMGKYSLFLIKALMKDADYKYMKTYIIFTKNMPLKDAVVDNINQAVPAAEILMLDLKVPFDSTQDNVTKIQLLNERILSQALTEYNDSSTTNDFLILSLFIDQVVSVFPDDCRKILLCYDLIPFQYYERYSKLTSYPNYLRRFRILLKADVILTISQTVADDVVVYLGIPSSKIFNIDGAPVERHTTVPQKPKVEPPKRYVLMPSGDDLRKNNTRAVQGFEQYRIKNGDDDIYLLITSFFNDETREKLSAFSPNIIFTGNVPEAELRWLYQHTEVLLFVPEYEGLGLPILEAAEADKPIVCSNLSVFNEISTQAFYYCEPLEPTTMADALADALQRKDYSEKSKMYPTILHTYSWESTTVKTLAALATNQSQDIAAPCQKLKLAVFSPSPGGYSTIGKWTMQLHATMTERFDIDYYLEETKSHTDFSRPNYLPFVANVFPVTSFTTKNYKQYDAVVYHIGNSEFHLETIKNALYLPGYAIFHDTYLEDVFKGPLIEYGQITRDRFSAERLLDEAVSATSSRFITAIVNKQNGIIVHSDYAQAAVGEVFINKPIPIMKANLPISVPKLWSYKADNRAPVIGFAGIIHEAKGLDVIEKVAASEAFRHCKIRIFGLSLVNKDVLQRLQVYPNVIIDTNLTDFEFQNILRNVDIIVNVRKVYKGETSASTLEAMRFGAVPIVKKVGWYDELPSDSVAKVKGIGEVLQQLEFLLNHPKDMESMKAKASELLTKEYSHELYVKKLYDFLIENHTQQSTNGKVTKMLKEGKSRKTIERLLTN